MALLTLRFRNILYYYGAAAVCVHGTVHVCDRLSENASNRLEFRWVYVVSPPAAVVIPALPPLPECLALADTLQFQHTNAQFSSCAHSQAQCQPRLSAPSHFGGPSAMIGA